MCQHSDTVEEAEYIIVIIFPRLSYLANICASNNNSKNWPVNKHWWIFDLWHLQWQSVANWQQYLCSYLPANLSGARGVTPYLQANASLIGTAAPSTYITMYCSQPPYTNGPSDRGLRRRSAAARLVELRVRIPPGIWMFASCKCCVFYR